MKLLTIEEIVAKYGQPGDVKNQVSIALPFPFYLDWDLTKSVSRIVCHKLIADRLKAALQEILEHYGLTKIHELGIDQFAGCFNYRPKRGYEMQYAAAIERGDFEAAIQYLSEHAWALAIDLDANRNKLRETAKTARFAKPEYKPMLDIFEKHGFLCYGRVKNFDWMHIVTCI